MFYKFSTMHTARALGLALLLSAVAGAADAKDYKVVHAFTGSEGDHPYAGVVADKHGNLYTTADSGGVGCTFGCGTVVKVAPDGTTSVLYEFKGGNDGAGPTAPIAIGKADNFYGTTVLGGSANCNGSGCGTVFHLAADGTETVLHAFTGGTDGWTPYGGVAVDSSGNVYGTAFAGGNPDCNAPNGCGVVFEVAANGTFSVLHAFAGGRDGAAPEGGVALDAGGNLFGTTELGGTGNCSIGPTPGCGVVFRVSAKGTEKILYTFQGGTDGEFPQANPSLDSSGNLFGTAYLGGDPDCRCGTVYELTADGTFTVLHDFARTDGALPYAGLLIGQAGNLFGTTEDGGKGCHPGGCGTVFEVTPGGTETVLYEFSEKKGGYYSSATPIADKKGNLYGTATFGGLGSCSDGCGTLFKLKVE